MSTATVEVDGFRFPPFDLVRLFTTVFRPGQKESFGIFTDLEEPSRVVDFAYLEGPGNEPQKNAHRVLYRGLLENRDALGADEVCFYGYEQVGGSNLDLPDTVTTADGETPTLRDALASHTIVLYMGRWSATAPLTALAKEMGFRGATMHGANDVILKSGLAVDYEEVSARAERLREAMTRADTMRMEWEVAGQRVSLDVEVGGQEAQKSHGLAREQGDVANLPAGEVYYVPTGAAGRMPMKFADAAGTVAIFRVAERGIVALDELVSGDEATARAFLARVELDRNAGQVTELGLGTQDLPWAHADIQDEKILGTAHLATGRSDHLGGDIGPADFKDKRNAEHNDILYTPVKTPDVALKRVTMTRDGEETLILEDYKPSAFVKRFL